VTAPRIGARAAGLEVGKTGAMLIGSVAVLAWPLHAAEADDAAPPAPPVVVTPLLTTSGQPIVLPRKDAQLVASIYDIAPGGYVFGQSDEFASRSATRGRAPSWEKVRGRSSGPYFRSSIRVVFVLVARRRGKQGLTRGSPAAFGR
jgi:hypothetical protein